MKLINRLCIELGAGLYFSFHHLIFCAKFSSLEKFRAAVPVNLIHEEDIRTFLREVALGMVERRKIKLVVLGKEQIGKTTLVNFLRYCNQQSVRRHSLV